MSQPGRPAYRLYKWLWAGLDLLLPPSCGGCGKRDDRWCTDCNKNVKLIKPLICDCCGRLVFKPGICFHCKDAKPSFTAIRSWAVFEGPVRNAIHRLKYKRDISLAETLTRFLIDLLGELVWEVDLIVPVPLGVARLKERGYNQAALLAWPIALSTGITYLPNALSRVRETRSQVGLSVEQRRENVSMAFEASPALVRGRNLLLIDDVTTSGSTLQACSAALLAGGAVSVFCLTVARAGYSPIDM